MNKKYKYKKSIREISTKRNWSGETSPYWNFMSKFNKSDGSFEGIVEDAVANPDVLSEDDHLYHRPLSEEGEIQFQFVRDNVKYLSKQQQRVLQLMAFEGLTLTQTAKELNLSISTVNEYLHVARQHLMKRYIKYKKDLNI